MPTLKKKIHNQSKEKIGILSLQRLRYSRPVNERIILEWQRNRINASGCNKKVKLMDHSLFIFKSHGLTNPKIKDQEVT